MNLFIVNHADENLQVDWFNAKKELLSTMPHPSKYSMSNSREHFAELYVLEVLFDGKGKLWSLIEDYIGRLGV